MADDCGYGMLGHVMMQFQNSFGTSLVDSLHAIAITDESLNLSIEDIIHPGMFSRFGESPYYKGIQIVEGEITQPANPVTLGWFLKAGLGLISTTSDTNTQTHIFRPRAADFDCKAAMDPMAFEVHRDVGSSAVYFDCVGNTLNINIANGELMNASLGVIGAQMTRQAAGTPTYPVSAPFRWDQASSSYNGQAIVDLNDIAFSINNNLEARHNLGLQNYPNRIKRTSQRVIEVTGSMVFAAHSYWQAFESKAENFLFLNFVGDNSPTEIKIEVPKLRFKTYEPVMAGPGLVEASFTGAAIYDQTSSYDFQVTLVNTQEYY
jgi:hypothetical protein